MDARGWSHLGWRTVGAALCECSIAPRAPVGSANCRAAQLALRFIGDSELSNSLARWLTRLRPWRDQSRTETFRSTDQSAYGIEQ